MRKASYFFYLAKITQTVLTPSPGYTASMHPYKSQLDTLYSRIQLSAELGETKLYARNLPAPISEYLQGNGFKIDPMMISWDSKSEYVVMK